MVGKNNKFLKENKNNQRFLRFSLRKLSVGVVSVAIAAGFYIGGSQSVLADTTSTDPVVRQNAPNDDSTVNTDKNTVNQQSASTSADSSAVAGAADSTAAEAVKSAASAAEQQKTTTLNVAEAKPAAASNTANLLYNKATFNVAEEKPVAALNTANLLDNKAQSKAASDAAAATVNDDDLLKNIKISNPTDPKFVQYQNLVDRYNSYMSYHYGEEKPSQYVFSVIRDRRIDTDFIWTVDQDTGKKVSVYFDEFNNWDSGITGHHQFNDDDFDDNHNDYRYSKYGVTLSYDKPEGSSGSISVVDDNHNILDLGDANLQDVYEINGNTDNSRSGLFAITLPEKGQPIIKFLYRNPDTGKLMDLRAPIYYSNGLTGQKFELDIGDSYKQELKDMFAGFKLVGSSKASGTFTQFAQGKTYVEHDASDDSEVIYQQIDAEGTMKVFYREKDGEKQPVLDTYGNPYQLKAGSSVKIDTVNGIITAYNPFVTGDHAYELIYETEDQSANIVYVDKDGNKIKTDTVNGKTTQTVDVKSNVPAGWKIIDGQVPETIHFKGEGTPDTTITIEHDTTSVDHTKPIKPGDKTPSGKEIKGAHESDLNQTITRTIKVTTPDGQTTTTKQAAKIYRDATIDDVTGEVTYGDWSEGTWADFKPGQVAGYTASPADVPAVTVKDGQKDQTVNISYTANDQTTHINYVDKDGKTIKSDTVSGKTDQNVKTNSEVPAGWKIIDGQVPEMIHFTGEGTPDTTITIEHDTTSVDHTKPIKPGDKTPSGKEIKGAHESDLNQTITRTINVTTPDGQTTTTKQVAKIYRDATIDDVTGEVTYGSWSEDTWADFKPGQLAGYTASQADVPAVTVKDGQKDQTVNISYTANVGTVLIKYVDRDGNEIGQQVITGHVGDTIKVTPQFPENWVPVDPDTVPAEVQIKEENGQIIIVVVRHAEKDPVQTKKVTRTIMVTTPDGQTKTIKQVVTISRHGDLDLVTGQIAWQPWTTAQWDVFKPAAIAGYTPSLAEVPAVTVDGETTDQTVDITYAAVATPAQQGHQAPTASDTPDAQQATNQKADSNAQPAVTVVTSQQTATAQQAESTTNSRRLPQTGNSHDASALAGLGLASLLMGLFGLGGKRRKRD